ncbi:RNA polymerase sigma factor SigW [Bacillus fonticola]|uniref:RNA polymerase sigma factor SigW n=1 Tax=Bacillus fonticola TaxID=2728853 RepID=UPI0014743E21|nr:RNA polymerase sigma factor SigW [Bacillus fonticola]
MDAFVKQRIKQVMKGDQDAFGEIVELYKDSVYHLCFRMLGNRHEAEDLAQEAFVRAYVNIHTFHTNKKFSTWLYRIATNLCIDWIRKRKPDAYLDAEVSGTEGLTMYSQVAANVEKPEEVIERSEMQQLIHKEIVNLPEKYRAVIILKYLKECSLQEISEMLELPLGTVKTRIHRGREALRKQLRTV